MDVGRAKEEIKNYAKTFLMVSELLGIDLPEKKAKVLELCKNSLVQPTEQVIASLILQQVRWFDMCGSYTEPPWMCMEQLRKWHELESDFFMTNFGNQVNNFTMEPLDKNMDKDEDSAMIVCSERNNHGNVNDSMTKEDTCNNLDMECVEGSENNAIMVVSSDDEEDTEEIDIDVTDDKNVIIITDSDDDEDDYIIISDTE